MWKIYSLIIQIIQILDITVDKESWNAPSPNSIEFKWGRSIHINITLIIPFISNEDQQKLYDSLPISPIWIVVKLGRFFNSNPPP